MDASEYKHVVLGLIFLKYISDKFEERYLELIKGDGFEEDKDGYTSENVFWVPKDARWNKIAKYAHNEEIGIKIDEAMKVIEKENYSLKGILPKTFSRPELNKQALGEVVDLFTNIQMSDHGDKKDILGRTYEYCLSKFAENEGKKAGEFYTPASVVKTLIEILKPFNGRVYDPCCGSGGMFVQSKNFIENHQGNIKNISIYGQDSNPTTWKMAKMNLAIRGIESNLGERQADTFLNDLHKTLKADFIIANPPFNLKKWGAEKLQDDPRWQYGIPPKGNANYAWIQHMIYHLSPNGKMGVILANGSLSSSTSGEGKIRENIIKTDLVEGIVALPTQLFYTTGIPVCLWIINRNKNEHIKGKTLFIDAREMGTMVSRKLRELSDEDIELIGKQFENFENDNLEGEKGFSAIAATEEIAKHDYILTPGRYVGFKDPEDDGIPFEEKMEELTKELDILFKKSNELEKDIRKSLGEIGLNFEIFQLSEIVEIKYGKSQKNVEIGNNEIPIYETGGIIGFASEFLHDNPSVLIPRKGSINKVKYIDIPFWTVDTLFYTKVNEKIVIPKYLYYLMSIIDLSQYDEGTTIPSLTTKTLNTLEFAIPHLSYQEKSIQILSSLDKKIEINNKINQNLEEQCKNIFNEWFFKYNFPDNNGSYAKSGFNDIPKGWHTSSLKNHVEFQRGTEPGSRNYKTKCEPGLIPFLRVGNLGNRNNEVFIEKNLTKEKILNKEDIALSLDGTVGIAKLGLYGCFSTGIRKLILKDDSITNSFLYFLVKSEYIQNIIKGNAKGTTILHAGNSIDFMDFILPPKEIITKFDNVVGRMFSKIIELKSENKKLERLKDLLLPKLMSGEIDVSEVEI
jgi:type I restriction enzyme M protein